MTNAIKDVAHPPGQVVNTVEAHQQLSDYIRSINRRDAFDQVAKEQKLTFDQWCDAHEKVFEHYSIFNDYPGSCYSLMEMAWQAGQSNI